METSVKSDNTTSLLECHELKADWEKIIQGSQYAIQGVCIAVVGTFGFVANLLSIYVLLQCKENRNFHRLLAALTIVDTVLIANLVLEMSVIGVFMKKEPYWYIVTYPFIIHPGRGMIHTSAIFMVVAVSTERYR